MSRRRLPLLVLVVAALVAIVALVAHGRPLAARAGKGGLPSSFWDFTLTSIIIVSVLVGVAVLLIVIYGWPSGYTPQTLRPLRGWRAIAIMIALAFLVYFIGTHVDFSQLLRRLHRPPAQHAVGGARVPKGSQGKPSSASPRFRWDEVAVVLGLLLVAGMVIATIRRRGTPQWPALGAAPAAVAAALDESLDDLRADPDLRRAIIAAYARMETALAAAGVPRRPSEAPLEYLERALLELDTSRLSVRRLTDLFEWARFSHHEPEPSMRDEAVDALEAVRDELRSSAMVAA